MKRKKVVRMLKEMQKTVYNSDMFEKAGLSRNGSLRICLETQLQN